VLVAPPAAWERLRAVAGVAGLADVRCTGGGERRQDSVRAGLDATGEQGIICVHDAARPLCPPQLFAAVVDAAARAGAATAAVPLVDSVKRVDGVEVTESLDRASLVAVQTPQACARHTNAPTATVPALTTTPPWSSASATAWWWCPAIPPTSR
jgi:2-C-methyl-D-erythritol 4-phosphate cytidylyltransferase